MFFVRDTNRCLQLWDVVESLSCSKLLDLNSIDPWDQIMFLWWEAGIFSSIAGMFSSIPDLCPLNENSSTHLPDLTTKNASRPCQQSPGEGKQNCPQ